MIARQRHNLGLTFCAAEQSDVPAASRERLFTNERELLDATREFAEGMAARGAAIPALDDACDAMRQAEIQLRATEYPPAVQSEQQALASLIRARKNIRQKLSPPSSSSATASRKFDHQQRQKLRTPEELKKQEQQKLAEARQQMNDLAQRQRKWSDEVKSASNSADPDQEPPPSPQKTESPSSPSQSSAQPAQSQQKMIDELHELQEALKQLDSGSEQAPQQAEQIAATMQSSLDALQREQANKAAEQSLQSAEQLDQLADHLAAMNSTDFGERLGHAQRVAQHLAQEQTELEQKLSGPKSSGGEAQPQAGKSNGGQAGSPGEPQATAGELVQQQRALASQAELLAELMSRLRADASEQAPAMQPSLESLHAANPPAEIAQQMNEAASHIVSGKPDQAARAVGDAARRLDELAKGLRQLRGEFGQPKLAELIAIEEQIAKLIEELDRAQSSGAPTAAESRLAGLEPKLDALAIRDARLAEALRQLRSGEPAEQPGQDSDKPGQATSSGGSQKSAATYAGKKSATGDNAAEHVPGGNQQTAPGFYSRSRWADRTGLRQVNKALQMKIQEAILAGALLDADDAVPPEYKDLVEKYYRELSDDLR